MQHEVGKISKQWSGFVREYFTAADNFGITFPMDLDVKMKANMIGALFLIVSQTDFSFIVYVVLHTVLSVMCLPALANR